MRAAEPFDAGSFCSGNLFLIPVYNPPLTLNRLSKRETSLRGPSAHLSDI